MEGRRPGAPQPLFVDRDDVPGEQLLVEVPEEERIEALGPILQRIELPDLLRIDHGPDPLDVSHQEVLLGQETRHSPRVERFGPAGVEPRRPVELRRGGPGVAPQEGHAGVIIVTRAVCIGARGEPRALGRIPELGRDGRQGCDADQRDDHEDTATERARLDRAGHCNRLRHRDTLSNRAGSPTCEGSRRRRCRLYLRAR